MDTQQEEPGQQIILSVKEAALYVGRSEKHLRRLIRDGVLRATREEIPGGFRFTITRAALDEGKARGLFPPLVSKARAGSGVGSGVSGRVEANFQPSTRKGGLPWAEGLSEVSPMGSPGLEAGLSGGLEGELEALRRENALLAATLADYRDRERRLLALLDRALPARADEPGQAEPPDDQVIDAEAVRQEESHGPAAAEETPRGEPGTGSRPGFWRRLFGKG